MVCVGGQKMVAATFRRGRSLRQVRHGLAVLAGALEVAGVDGCRGQLTGLASVRSPTRAPHAAGLGAVGLGVIVAHGLDGDARTVPV